MNQPIACHLFAKQFSHQRSPLLFERRAMEGAPCACIPIVRVVLRTLFAVEVGMYRHAIPGLKLVYEAVGLRPVALRIPPQRCQWRCQPLWRKLLPGAVTKLGYGHRMSLRRLHMALPPSPIK